MWQQVGGFLQTFLAHNSNSFARRWGLERSVRNHHFGFSVPLHVGLIKSAFTCNYSNPPLEGNKLASLYFFNAIFGPVPGRHKFHADFVDKEDIWRYRVYLTTHWKGPMPAQLVICTPHLLIDLIIAQLYSVLRFIYHHSICWVRHFICYLGHLDMITR